MQIETTTVAYCVLYKRTENTPALYVMSTTTIMGHHQHADSSKKYKNKSVLCFHICVIV